MTIRDRKALKNSAKNALAYSAYSPRKLFGIHIAVTAGITLVLSFLNYFLAAGIDTTGGLDGIGSRAILQTIQELLSFAQSLALPFWQIGLVFVALQLFRRQPTEPATLLTGFRRIGPVLRLYILKYLILVAVVFGVMNIIMTLIFLSPLTNILAAFAETWLSSIETMTEEEILLLMEDPAFAEQLLKVMLPIFLAMMAALYFAIILILYRIRLADYVLMDHPEMGARNAVKTSWKLTKGNCLSLFKLDLSFWWFYGLELLLSGFYIFGFVATDLLDAGMMTLVCDLVFCIGQVALYAWANAYLQTTYAAAYEVLLFQKEQEEEEARRQAAQTFTPWDLPPCP